MFIEFPRIPTGIIKRHVTDEADARLAVYLPTPPDAIHPGLVMPPRPQLPEGVIDTPIIRLFNFLRTSVLLGLFFFPLNHPRNDVPILSARNPMVSSMVNVYHQNALSDLRHRPSG